MQQGELWLPQSQMFCWYSLRLRREETQSNDSETGAHNRHVVSCVCVWSRVLTSLYDMRYDDIYMFFIFVIVVFIFHICS
jgi:hypothetical protein